MASIFAIPRLPASTPYAISGRRLLRDRPNRSPAQLCPRNRGGDHGLQFPRMGRQLLSTAEPPPGPSRLCLGLACSTFSLAQKEIATDTCWKPVALCRLDQRAPRRASTPAAVNSSAGVASPPLRNARKERDPDGGHELPRIGETGDVAEEVRHQASLPRPAARGHAAPQRLHHWRQRAVRKRGFDVGFKMIPPRRRLLDGRDAIFQHDVMRCVFRTTIRRASAGASGSKPAGYNDGAWRS